MSFQNFVSSRTMYPGPTIPDCHKTINIWQTGIPCSPLSVYFLLFSVHPHSCRCKWLCPLHRWVLVQYMGKDLCFHAASLATTSWSTWPPHNLTNPENQSSVHIPTEGQPNTKRWCWIGRRTPKGFSSWIYHLLVSFARNRIPMSMNLGKIKPNERSQTPKALYYRTLTMRQAHKRQI